MKSYSLGMVMGHKQSERRITRFTKIVVLVGLQSAACGEGGAPPASSAAPAPDWVVTEPQPVVGSAGAGGTATSSRTPEPETAMGGTGAGSKPAERMPTQSQEEQPAPGAEALGLGSSPLGGRCASDLNCIEGLQCFVGVGTSTLGPVSVAGGYCSIPCEESDTCTPLGAGSYCNVALLNGRVGFCTRPCEVAEASQEKCLGRDEVHCASRPGRTGTCQPNCNLHSQCAPGWCDYGTGYCDSILNAEPQAPIGSACVEGAEFNCDAFCYGEPGRDRLCTGSCRAGAPCGGSEDNVCVPERTGQRSGDTGFCERRCQSSSDCVPGLTECAPTGYRLESGEREGGCWLAEVGGSTIRQRLSLEEMRLPVVPELAVSVRSDSSFPRGPHELFAGEEGVCVRGAFASQRSQISLAYLFATADGAVSGGAASEALAVTLEASQRVLVDAYQVDRPGTPYRLRHVPASTPRQLSTGEHRLGWATFVAEEEPFDPSKLERITFRTSGTRENPFEVCISKIQLEL